MFDVQTKKIGVKISSVTLHSCYCQLHIIFQRSMLFAVWSLESLLSPSRLFECRTEKKKQQI